MKAWGLFAALALLPAWGRGQAQEDEVAIQRRLGDLHLGDSLEAVRRVYSPVQKWPSFIEPRGRVTRMRVERAYVKSFPNNVQTLWLGFKRGGLVEIQIIYNLEFSRRKSAEALAGDLALIYGEPQRGGGKSSWTDGKTVLRVFNAELPVLKGRTEAVELRTAIQIFEHGLSRRTD